MRLMRSEYVLYLREYQQTRLHIAGSRRKRETGGRRGCKRNEQDGCHSGCSRFLAREVMFQTLSHRGCRHLDGLEQALGLDILLLLFRPHFLPHSIFHHFLPDIQVRFVESPSSYRRIFDNMLENRAAGREVPRGPKTDLSDISSCG